jgi:hypothetical protein
MKSISGPPPSAVTNAKIAAMTKPQSTVSRTPREKAGRKLAPIARPTICSAAVASPSRK